MSFLLVSIGAFFAGFVQTITGFAGAIMLSLFINTSFNAIAMSTINNMVCVILSPIIIIPYVKKIKWKFVFFPWIFYIPTSSFLVTRLKNFNLGTLKIAFGAFLILLALYFLFFANKIKVSPSVPLIIAVSMISGCCQAFFAIGGPLMALYFSQVLDDKEEYIATTQAFFIAASISSFITRCLSGLVLPSYVPYMLVGWVMIIIGRVLAKRVFERIDAALLRKLIYFVMIIAGAFNIVTQLAK